jgi:hypothetical protein
MIGDHVNRLFHGQQARALARLLVWRPVRQNPVCDKLPLFFVVCVLDGPPLLVPPPAGTQIRLEAPMRFGRDFA